MSHSCLSSYKFFFFFAFLARCIYILYLFIGKIGYGTASEALACKLPLVFVRRDYFNEEPFLRNLLEVQTFLIIVLC
jgi:UDP-N-acetylglucosamine:LPS N-acetylglucosamine transferase